MGAPNQDAYQLVFDPHVLVALGAVTLALVVTLLLLALVNAEPEKRK